MSVPAQPTTVGASPAHGGQPPGSPGLDFEAEFEAAAAEWWNLGRELSAELSAGYAHAPACVTNASDLGCMMAWARAAAAGAAPDAIGDDPWLIRQLGREAKAAPPIWPLGLRLVVRGYAARGAFAFRAVAAGLALRDRRPVGTQPGGTALLVYGHPASVGTGRDAYFGDLMERMPGLVRLLHVDCTATRAKQIATDGRTASLHAWGSPWFALRLPFVKWRPRREHRAGPWGWLVRRAAVIEGGTGQAAAMAWQIHCQRRWLEATRPRLVAWPWENHSWERALVRDARRLGVRTVGYQHSVIGRHMLNYAPKSNPDGLASIPDLILCTGEATRNQLIAWGVPEDRLEIGGALRFREVPAVRWDPDAPVLVALPFAGSVAAEMVEAARRAAAPGRRRFIIKPHPMSPHQFEPSPGVERTEVPLGGLPTLAAVVYAATTVGLEALLAGLPTLRYRPRGRLAADILPAGLAMPSTGIETLTEDLDNAVSPSPVEAEQVFAGVRTEVWDRILGEGAVAAK